MRVICAYKIDGVPLHALKPHPNIGLYVFHDVPNMEVAVGIGQGGGNEDLTQRHGAKDRWGERVNFSSCPVHDKITTAPQFVAPIFSRKLLPHGIDRAGATSRLTNRDRPEYGQRFCQHQVSEKSANQRQRRVFRCGARLSR